MTKLAAIPIDTFVFIVLVLIASFFRWITKQADAAKRSAGSDSKPSAPRKSISPRDETDADRVRRFLEALGQPTSSAPPPPIEKRAKRAVERRVVIPKGRTVFAPLSPLTTVPPPLPFETEISSAAIGPVATPTAASLAIKAPALSPITFPETVQESPMQTEVLSLVSSARGLRDAIILREVFGPPRSLQSLEF